MLLTVQPGSVSLPPPGSAVMQVTGERQVGFRKECFGGVGVKGIRAAEGPQACEKSVYYG